MSEDAVREILVRAKRSFGNAWGAVYRGEAEYSPEWEQAQRLAVGQAIERARSLLKHLDEATVQLFERYRIADLNKYLESSLRTCRDGVRVTPGGPPAPPTGGFERRRGPRQIAFEKVTAADLPRSVQAWRVTDDDGVYYQAYSDGHLKKVALYLGGQQIDVLTLEAGRAEARWEDGANVAEFHCDGLVEEYGGRYDRDSIWSGGFRDWILDRVNSMLVKRR